MVIRFHDGQPRDGGMKGKPLIWRHFSCGRGKPTEPKPQNLPVVIATFLIVLPKCLTKKVVFLTEGDNNNKKTIQVRPNNVGNRKVSYKWVVTIVIWTFVISSTMQMIQAGLMSRVTLLAACFLLFSFILIGIVFDIVGVSVTAASEVPFHSLSSRRVRGAKEAIRLIRNADKVGNFCNDVIGDIAGIISGSATTAIVLMLNALSTGNHEYILNIVLAGLVAALTVGGKAVGKGVAISNCNRIVFTVGKLISFFKPVRSKKKQNKKRGETK